MVTKKDGDFLRVIASIAVIVVHSVHYWVEQYAKNQTLWSLNYFTTYLDQLSRFTVPLFLFLSGFGLTAKYVGSSKPLDVNQYYRKRLLKIFVPFLMWTAITSFRHVDYVLGLPWKNNALGSLTDVLRFVFFEGFDYQYYFLIVLFQLYMIFPWVYRLAKSKSCFVLFLGLHLLLMAPSETFADALGISPLHFHPNWLILHWFFCYAGMFVAWNQEWIEKIVESYSPKQAWLFWLFCFALINAEVQINLAYGKELWNIDHCNRWSIMLYCAASLLVFLKIKPWLEQTIYANKNFQFIFTHLAPYTFFVYLVHTHFLRWVEFAFWEVSLFDLFFRIIMVTGCSYIMAWFVQWLLADFPRLRYSLALPHKPFDWRGLPGASYLLPMRLKSESKTKSSGEAEFG